MTIKLVSICIVVFLVLPRWWLFERLNAVNPLKWVKSEGEGVWEKK